MNENEQQIAQLTKIKMHIKNSLPFTHVVIHHTGAEEKDAAQVRRYHLSLGWQDVGYHFIIERCGLIVPGRSMALRGAHCVADGMNHRAVGIVLIGNFQINYPSYQQIVSLKQLLNVLQQQLPLEEQYISLHRQVLGAKTVCPGKNFPDKFIT